MHQTMLVDRRFSSGSNSEPCKAALALAVARRNPEAEAEALVDREAEAEAPVAQEVEAVVSRLPSQNFKIIRKRRLQNRRFFIFPFRSARLNLPANLF